MCEAHTEWLLCASKRVCASHTPGIIRMRAAHIPKWSGPSGFMGNRVGDAPNFRQTLTKVDVIPRPLDSQSEQGFQSRSRHRQQGTYRSCRTAHGAIRGMNGRQVLGRKSKVVISSKTSSGHGKNSRGDTATPTFGLSSGARSLL